MALLKNNAVVEDPFTDVSGRETIPAQGAVLVDLDQWQEGRKQALKRRDPVASGLKSDQPAGTHRPNDLESLALGRAGVSRFRDGRALSYARSASRAVSLRRRVKGRRRPCCWSSSLHGTHRFDASQLPKR